MSLAVLIPVFNEERTVGELLERVLKVPVVDEIIIVDDASQDATVERILPYLDSEGEGEFRTLGAGAGAEGGYPSSGVEASSRGLTGRPSVRLLRHERNRGKGAAIRTGLEAVTADLVVIQDGDLEYDPRDFVPMLELHRTGHKIVYGSRVLGKNKFSYVRFYLGGRLLSILSNLLYGLRISDEPTCYKMFPTELLRAMELECERFEFCPEVTAKAARMGYAIAECPIRYTPRSLEEGKKIGFRDGWEAIRTLLRYRFWRPRQRGLRQE